MRPKFCLTKSSHNRLCTTHKPHLHPRLRQLGPLRQLFPRVHVGVLRPLESSLQLLQLLRREGGSRAPLLPLDGDARLALGVTVGDGAAAPCRRDRHEPLSICGGGENKDVRHSAHPQGGAALAGTQHGHGLVCCVA